MTRYAAPMLSASGHMLVKSHHQRDVRGARLIPMCLLMGLELVCTAPRLSAAEQQPAHRHSLIHRQEFDSRPAEPRTAAPTSPTPPTSNARSLHRKLTKRPGQMIVTAPSAASAQNPTRSDSRLSMGGAALAQQAPSPFTTTAPISSAITGTSVPLAGATLSAAKPTAASALASAGVGAAVSSGSSVTGGRGMQRLAGQMPGLSQLLAPTVSVSSPPTAPPPPTSPPPPPPGTGSALLSWTINSESDLAGYKIYVGTTSGQYIYPGSPIVIGRAGSYTVTGLPAGQTYYFAISAFNYSGGESGLSAEVSKSIY